MAYTWKSDTAEATSNMSPLTSDDGYGTSKAGMYGLVNNHNYIVEAVNATADTKATNCTKLSESTRWSVQFGTTRTSPTTTGVTFCAAEVASHSDFNSLRSAIATTRNRIGTDSEIYCSTAKTPYYASDQSSKHDSEHSGKSLCPEHNSSYNEIA